MNITREVINDLLPLYVAGEASPDTVSLITDYQREHPEIAADIEALRADSPALLSLQVNPTKEKEILSTTKQLLNLRGILLGLAIFLTSMPASFVFRNNRFEWIFFRDAPPTITGLIGILALAAWAALVCVRRRLVLTGL